MAQGPPMPVSATNANPLTDAANPKLDKKQRKSLPLVLVSELPDSLRVRRLTLDQEILGSNPSPAAIHKSRRIKHLVS